MILLIAGASHTGKTNLAQKLLEKYGYPYLSIDHLKMGLIRSGHTDLTPESSDDALTGYLWPIVREIIKTAVENEQNLIVEGCYIPFDWAKDFEPNYLSEIKYCCLVMSEDYIRNNYNDIIRYENVVEMRHSYYIMDELIHDNTENLKMCRLHGVKYCLIDSEYPNLTELFKI